MGPVATSEAPELIRQPMTERSAMRLFEPTGLTLEDVVLDAWEDLVAGSPAECPVCGGRLRAAAGCEACGSDLS